MSFVGRWNPIAFIRDAMNLGESSVVRFGTTIGTDTTFRFGSGAPTAADPNGSWAIDVGATSLGAALYHREGGAWVAADLGGAGGTQTDLIFKAATELTIATGTIVATQGSHTVDTEGDAASDDLDTMTGGTAEEIVLLRPASAARTVVIKHAIGANRFACPGETDVSLAEATDWALVAYNGTQWVVLAASTLAKIWQPVDAELTALAGLTSAADKGIVFTGAGAAATFDLTAAARTVLDDASTNDMLATLSAQDTRKIAVPSLTAAAEAGNAIAVTIALKDGNGNALARTQRLKCQVIGADGVIGLVAAWTLAETGAGSEVSTTARPTLYIDTDANGAATVTVTDVSGVYAGTMYLEVTPISVAGASPVPGMPTMIALTFA